MTDLHMRARLAAAQMDLAAAEFGFNPGQKRGPDGRFIKMGGRGSAGKGGFPKGHGRASEGGGAGAGGSDTPRVDAHGVAEGTRAAKLRDEQTDRIRASKRQPADGDRVPMADGSTGTVVGGPHRVTGRPGLYVAVRPEGGGRLKEVKVSSIHERQERAASGVAAPDPEPTREEIEAYNTQIERSARNLRDAAVDEGRYPGGFDVYKERELSDRLQELADAREAGNDAAVDRAIERIRQVYEKSKVGGRYALPRRLGEA